MKHSSIAWAIFFALVVLSCTQAFGQTFVVATPELQGAYKGAVMLAVPFEDGHIGIILNRPSQVSLAELFPDHEPSKKVKDPVYIGGPERRLTLFAVVPGEQPHPTAIELMPGLWLVSHAATIDRIIEARPNEARYFGGFVGWRPGELEEEVKKGYFVLRPADKAKALQPDTSGLWEELHPKKGQVQSNGMDSNHAIRRSSASTIASGFALSDFQRLTGRCVFRHVAVRIVQAAL